MLRLDIHTLIIICALSAAVSGLGLLMVAAIYPATTRSILYWMAANVLHALGGALLAARGEISDLLSIVAANSMVVLGLVLHYHALATFFGKSISLRLPVIMTGIVSVSFTYFLLVVPNEQVRILIGSTCIFVLCGLCALLLFRQKPLARSWLCRSMAFGHLFIGSIWLVRAFAGLLVVPSTEHVFAVTPLLGVAFAATLLVMIFHTLGFVLLINDRATAELERLASIDGLTQVFNRRAMEAMASHIVAHSRRTLEPCAVVIIDADCFKHINDTYGHAAGDQVLREMVRTLLKSVRAQDIVGRFGGEEFLVILPGTTQAEALIVANRICTAIASTRIQLDLHSLSVTISAGVAALASDDASASSLIVRADRALFEAKAQGRNQVMIATGMLV
jgi:diguanylate cyclase (GGDEF)-like protein